MSILIARSEFLDSNTYYIFRPIGNGQYLEIPFRIVNGVILQDKKNLLQREEVKFIRENISIV